MRTLPFLTSATRAALACVLAGLVLAGPAPALGEQGAVSFGSLRHSVVKIYAREMVARCPDPSCQELLTHQGTGVIVSPEGRVLTVAHLVQSVDEVEVEFADGVVSSARVYAAEPAADVALLELREPREGLRSAFLADSDSVSVGDAVTIVGFPFGLEATATFGRVSGLLSPGTPFGKLEEFRVLTVDAHVLQGASGGPLFDSAGRVVGLATRLMTNRGESVGIGFAVASNTARALLLERRSLWTGMAGRLLSGNLARALNVPQPRAFLVERIAAYSPASAMAVRAGNAAARILEDELMLGGDIILSIQGISLAEADAYTGASAALAALKDGERMHMTILRGGEVVTLEASLQRARR